MAARSAIVASRFESMVITCVRVRTTPGGAAAAAAEGCRGVRVRSAADADSDSLRAAAGDVCAVLLAAPAELTVASASNSRFMFRTTDAPPLLLLPAAAAEGVCAEFEVVVVAECLKKRLVITTCTFEALLAAAAAAELGDGSARARGAEALPPASARFFSGVLSTSYNNILCAC